MISDGQRLYLTGSSGIRAFEHKQKKPKPDKPKPEGGGGKPKPEGSAVAGSRSRGAKADEQKPQGHGKPKPRQGEQGHGGKQEAAAAQANLTPPKPSDVTPDQATAAAASTDARDGSNAPPRRNQPVAGRQRRTGIPARAQGLLRLADGVLP